MPMNMPTLADLQDLYGAGSVSALQQAEQQQGLARQYAQQEVQQAQNKTQEGTLKNLFDAEQNPQLIQQRGLENIGLGNKNITEGVAARRAAANEGMQLSEDQRKFALTATQQDLDMADKWAEGEIRSGDPQRMQEARKILDFSSAARAAKALSDTAMERQKEQTRSHLGGIGMQVQGQKDLRKMDIDAGKYNKTGAAAQGISGIQSAVTSGKMTAEKAAVALHGAAMFEPDPELKQKYEQMAGQYEQFAMQQRNAAAGGKLDLGGVTGMPTQVLPPVLGGAAPAAAKPSHSLADVSKMYPGVPAAKIKQAYKQKFGVDLQ